MGESFIPWSQIEPLLVKGMSADVLKAALCKLTGLDPAKYRFVTKAYRGPWQRMTLAEAMRDGLWAERYDAPDGTSTYIDARDQPVR